eukprot:1664041-Rhodomonas_salina.1
MTERKRAPVRGRFCCSGCTCRRGGGSSSPAPPPPPSCTASSRSASGGSAPSGPAPPHSDPQRRQACAVLTAPTRVFLKAAPTKCVADGAEHAHDACPQI